MAKVFDKSVDESLAKGILSVALGTIGGKLVANKVASIASSFVLGAKQI